MKEHKLVRKKKFSIYWLHILLVLSIVASWHKYVHIYLNTSVVLFSVMFWFSHVSFMPNG
jgi:glutamate/tyrosine decarboxylase-like PLP-dependent enzyme